VERQGGVEIRIRYERGVVFVLKELGHRDEAKRTHSRTVLDIREDEEG
jgi:hypothetical protein